MTSMICTCTARLLLVNSRSLIGRSQGEKYSVLNSEKINRILRPSGELSQESNWILGKHGDLRVVGIEDTRALKAF